MLESMKWRVWRVWTLLLAAVAGLGSAASGQETGVSTGAAGHQRAVYVIPVRGMIEPALVYVVRRGAAEAQRTQASAVILVIDTPGGRVDAAQDIVRILQQVRVPTYAFIERNAFSAGAYIAMACRYIYMAPGSSIGAASPMMMTPFGGVQELPDNVEEKITSAFASMFRAAAQQGGHDPEVAEAMVRPEKELRIGDEIISRSGELLTLTNEEAARVYPGRDRPLLSRGTVRDLDELLQVIGLAGAEVKSLQVTSAERLARWIAALAPLLLIAGLLGLYIEFRTPGFGVPGIVGIVCLAAFFWGHHIAGLAGWEELVIFLTGLALLLVEVFVTPGFGFVGVTGLALMALGLVLTMADRAAGGSVWPAPDQLMAAGVRLAVALAGVSVGGWAVSWLLPHTPMGRRLTLAASTSRAAGYTAAPEHAELVGREGVALSALRPAGVARIDGRRLDVLTDGEFINAGTPVRVTRVEGSRIFVTVAQPTDPPGT